MSDKHWTASEVEAWLAEAADTLRRLPERRIGGYQQSWPDFPLDPRDAYGWTETRMRRIPPSPAAINRMENVLGWLRYLEPTDRRIAWLKASGYRWKAICWQVGLSRSAANEHWLYALCVITLRLNHCRLNRNQSRRKVIQRARSV